MRLFETLDLVLGVVMMLCGFAGIGITFYLGRTKMKEIDPLVLGYKISHDSIFYQLLRMSRYGGAFSSPWLAKRIQLTHIRDHFDKDFQRPFIIAHRLLMIAGVYIFLIIILDQFS